MISTRRKPVPDPLKILSHYHLAISECKDLTRPEFDILNVCYILQMETNDFVSSETIAQRLCKSVFNVNEITYQLCNRGYLERISERGNFNVTTKGEYTLRGLSIVFSRLLNETELSKWERLKKGDKRRAYLRQPVTKGVKLY